MKVTRFNNIDAMARAVIHQPTQNTDRPADTWRLFIPDFFPKSLNRTQDRHWSHRHRGKKRIYTILHAYCLQAGGVPRFDGYVRLTITRLWGKGQRALDPVNLWGAVKQLEDVMRKRKPSGRGQQGGLGIIEDDDPRHCKLTVDQRRNDTGGRHGDDECTLIEIEGSRVA